MRRRGSEGWSDSVPWLLAAMSILAAAQRVGAITHLKRDAEPPAIALKDQDGAEISTEKLRGRVVVLIFGELYHEKTRQACAAIDEAMRERRLAGQAIVPVLVTARAAGADERKAWGDAHLSTIVVRDPERKTFGDYRVAVMPSVVVIDREWRVVNAEAGLGARFSDTLTDSLLYACGKLSAEAFERSLKAGPATQPTEAELRVGRITQLARQLVRRGLPAMAAEKYREALQLDATHSEARLGLATLLLNERRLAEAEAEFRKVEAQRPASTQALLGIAFVQTLRGGSELDEAEKTARAVLARSPSEARAHYLLGLIQERRNKPAEAAASFKRSAELMLERAEPE